MTPTPSLSVPDLPRCSQGKVLVVNGDLHGRSFNDMYGNEILPGQMAWLNEAHADALNQMNRFWKRVEI